MRKHFWIISVLCLFLVLQVAGETVVCCYQPPSWGENYFECSRGEDSCTCNACGTFDEADGQTCTQVIGEPGFYDARSCEDGCNPSNPDYPEDCDNDTIFSGFFVNRCAHIDKWGYQTIGFCNHADTRVSLSAECLDKEGDPHPSGSSFSQFGDFIHVGLHPGRNDNLAYCLYDQSPSAPDSQPATWLDCDSNNWFKNWCNPSCDSWDSGACTNSDWDYPNAYCGSPAGVQSGERTPHGEYRGVVKNSGFERGSSNDAEDWNEHADHTRSDERAHSGSYSLKSSWTGTGPGVSTWQEVDVPKNTMFNLTGYIYREKTDLFYPGNAYLDLHDAVYECHAGTTAGVYNQWEYVQCNFTSDSSGTVRIRAVTDGDNADGMPIYFDDIAIRAGDSILLETGCCGDDANEFFKSSGDVYSDFYSDPKPGRNGTKTNEGMFWDVCQQQNIGYPTVGGEAMVARQAHPSWNTAVGTGTTVHIYDKFVPDDAYLVGYAGIADGSRNSGGVWFTIRISTTSKMDLNSVSDSVVWSGLLVNDTGWVPFAVDLSNYAGSIQRFWFTTHPERNSWEGDTGYDWAQWGKTEIIVNASSPVCCDGLFDYAIHNMAYTDEDDTSEVHNTNSVACCQSETDCIGGAYPIVGPRCCYPSDTTFRYGEDMNCNGNSISQSFYCKDRYWIDPDYDYCEEWGASEGVNTGVAYSGELTDHGEYELRCSGTFDCYAACGGSLSCCNGLSEAGCAWDSFLDECTNMGDCSVLSDKTECENLGCNFDSEEECCGDDPNEYYINDGVNPARCCNESDKIVDASGNCYEATPCDPDLSQACCDSEGSYLPNMNTDNEPSVFDNQCPASSSGSCYSEDWTFLEGNAACCGDDNQEYYVYYDQYATNGCNDITNPVCVGKSDDVTDGTCCPQSQQCVFESTCYNDLDMADIDGDGVLGEWCNDWDLSGDNPGRWSDCDSNNYACETICDYNYVYGGESVQFGEYDTGAEEECCEDDAGENYITAGVGEPRCCADGNTCVDGTNNCRSGTETLGVNCDDDIDNDCDGLTDDEDPNCLTEESHIAGNCNDGIDNDGDDLTDYDNMNDPEHGDDGCDVGIIDISLSAAEVVSGNDIDITCTVDPTAPKDRGYNSIFAYVDRDQNGVWSSGDEDLSWEDGDDTWDPTYGEVYFNNEQIDCDGQDTVHVVCGVYSSPTEPWDRSYQNGTDKSHSITCIPSTCSEIENSVDCATAGCRWCDTECDGNKYYPNYGMCVEDTGDMAADCGPAVCTFENCTATCDGSTACSGNQECDYDTCQCEDQECDPDSSPQCCDNETGYYPNVDVSQPIENFAENCPPGTSCYNIKSNGICCGDDDSEYFTYLVDQGGSACSDIYDNNCVGGSDPSDKFCCSGENDCVYGGDCYIEDTKGDPDADSIPGAICIAGEWRDCDADSTTCTGALCGLDYVQGGESSQFGEYNSGTASECCGDDDNENYVSDGVGDPRCCQDGKNCVDSLNLCRDEFGVQESQCNDGNDTDCDGEWDYDTQNRGASGPSPHGDDGCPVGIDSITLSDTEVISGRKLNITCNVNPTAPAGTGYDSIFAYIDRNGNGIYDAGDTDFTWDSDDYWPNDDEVVFRNETINCLSAPSVDIACGVYNDSREKYNRSYQNGPDVWQTVTCLEGCGDLEEGDCNADPQCTWCDQECDGPKYYPDYLTCVDASTGCADPVCTQGKCIVDGCGMSGGCTLPATCDTDTCLCTDEECDPDAGQQCCDNETGYYPNVDVSQPIENFAENCPPGSSCYDIGFGVGTQGLCCGDDQDEFFEYRHCHTSGAGMFCPADVTTDNSCCDNTDDCVYNGDCYAALNIGYHLGIGDSESDAVCIAEAGDGKWYDCDNSSTTCAYCDSGTNLPDCSGIDCYVESGEDFGHGEYQPGETECCGDDVDEIYVTAGLGPERCCSDLSNCVDLTGHCQTEWDRELTCDDGIDNDCDGLTDLEDPHCQTEESHIAGNCNDGIDNDGDGETDYDNRDGIHGDDGCDVGIIDISLSAPEVVSGSDIDITCTVDPTAPSGQGYDSIFAYIDRDQNGVYSSGDEDLGWEDGDDTWSATYDDVYFNNEQIDCDGQDTVHIVCGVYSGNDAETIDRSHQNGTDKNQSITCIPGTCSEIDNPTDCATAGCRWCDTECDGNKYYPNYGTCVEDTGDMAADCGPAVCTFENCTATCDGSTACSGYQECDYDTCQCEDQVCNPDTFTDGGIPDSACCDNETGLVPSDQVDNNIDEFMDACPPGSSCYSTSWIFESGVANCCGDDFFENYVECYDSDNSNNAWCSGADEACCSSATDCVNTTGDCVVQGQCHGFGTGHKSYCSNARWQDPDELQSYCDSTCDTTAGDMGIDWTAGGGQLNCCGDDEDEYYNYFRLFRPNMPQEEDHGKAQNDTTDNACCTGADKCVFNGICYDPGEYIDYDNDGREDYFCLPESQGDDGSWLNLDYAIGVCEPTYFWNVGGEAVSEDGYYYDAFGHTRPNFCNIASGDHASQMCCCGDDANEEYNYRRDYAASTCNDRTNENCTGGSNSGDEACCDNSGDCVFDGDCYASGTMLDVNLDTVAGERCVSGEWRDCDGSQSFCENQCGFDYAENGETSSFGEYDLSTSTECCGDDLSEYYVFRDVQDQGDSSIVTDTNDDACCDKETDCVFNGECFENSTTIWVDGGQHEVMCYEGGWYDIDDENYCLENDYGWQIGGEVGGDECCGDDVPEFIRYEESLEEHVSGLSEIEFDDNEDACCDSQTDCVNGSNCYSSNTQNEGQSDIIEATTGNLNIGGNDTYSHCYSGLDSNGNGTWLDCDDADFMDFWCADICGPQNPPKLYGDRTYAPDTDHNAVTAGESNVGEYYDLTTPRCCGDDSFEYYKNFTKYVGGANAFVNKELNTEACCREDNNCVDKDNLCVQENNAGFLNDTDDYDRVAYCGEALESDQWIDCDYEMAKCTGCNALLGTVGLEAHWTRAGEFVGEYTNVLDDYECCGDDLNETYKYLKRNADVNNDISMVWPDDPNTNGCCNNTNDCVNVSGACYEDNENANNFNPTGNDNIALCEPGFDRWYDCDSGSAQCQLCDLNWTQNGETFSFGEYDLSTSTECCGDDLGETFRFREVVSTSKESLIEGFFMDRINYSDNACCDNETDCVFEGKCYKDYDIVYAQLELDEQQLASECSQYEDNDNPRIDMKECNEDDRCQWVDGECRIRIYNQHDLHDQIYTDIDGDGWQELCDPGEWHFGDTNAVFFGWVKNSTGQGVPNATVEFVGYDDVRKVTYRYNVTTNGSGYYESYVIANATYDLMASKIGFRSDTVTKQEVEIFDVKEINFTIVWEFEPCESDCTYINDRICHRECNGKVGCEFFDANTTRICNNKNDGWVRAYNSTHEIICCEGEPYETQELRVVDTAASDVEHLVRQVRVVVFRGKPTKLVIDVFK